MKPKNEKSFLSTFPGILTGIAAVISAIAALYIALHQSPEGSKSAADLNSRKVDKSVADTQSQTIESSTSAKENEHNINESVLFSDDFSTKQNWFLKYESESGNTFYENGEFILQNNSNQRAYFFRLNKAGFFPPSVRIEVDVSLLRGNLDQPFGLIFGAVDNSFNSAYSFIIRADGNYQMLRWREDGYDKLISINDSTNIITGRGRMNRLKIEIQEKVIVYYINNIQLGKYFAPSEVRGYVGFYTNWSGMEVAFDNLKVTQLF